MKPHPGGRAGEDFAVKSLLALGFKIAERNFSCRFGEVDVIATRAGIVAFVEVKTRRPDGMVSGIEAVTPAKQRRIIATAIYYMKLTGCELQPRFDIFSVVAKDGKVLSHDYLEGAFDSEEYYKRRH